MKTQDDFAAAFKDQTIDVAVSKIKEAASHYTHDHPVAAFFALTQDLCASILEAYESVHGISSDEFYERYLAGHYIHNEPIDGPNWALRWATYYEISKQL